MEFITSFGLDSDDDAYKPVLRPVSGASAKTGLKRLRELTRTEERKSSTTLVMGPMLPPSDAAALNLDKKSRSVHKHFSFFCRATFSRQDLFSFSFFLFFGSTKF